MRSKHVTMKSKHVMRLIDAFDGACDCPRCGGTGACLSTDEFGWRIVNCPRCGAFELESGMAV